MLIADTFQCSDSVVSNLSVSTASLSIMDVPLKCDSKMYSWLEGDIPGNAVIFSVASYQVHTYIHATIMLSSLGILVGLLMNCRQLQLRRYFSVLPPSALGASNSMIAVEILSTSPVSIKVR